MTWIKTHVAIVAVALAALAVGFGVGAFGTADSSDSKPKPAVVEEVVPPICLDALDAAEEVMDAMDRAGNQTQRMYDAGEDLVFGGGSLIETSSGYLKLQTAMTRYLKIIRETESTGTWYDGNAAACRGY